MTDDAKIWPNTSRSRGRTAPRASHPRAYGNLRAARLLLPGAQIARVVLDRAGIPHSIPKPPKSKE